jgi:Domain of unknown function (DUF4082)/Fibronectin type III domain/Bacterial Ig domain
MLGASGWAAVGAAPAAAAGPCGPPVANPIACENTLPGDPASDWQINGVGDSTIQGFATSTSVNAGQTINFKIKTPSTKYHFDILRLGYYGGDGARMIASNLKPSATLPQTQPSCLTDSSTGLIDCGNWSVSASWTVPSNAVSGIYIAHLSRDDAQDPGGESQIMFVVRNDSSHSDILASTSDATWAAYNTYGGNSLYTCTVACPAGNPLGYKGAYAVSYNRPFDGGLSVNGGASDFFYAEYQMVRFLERNGYDVSYTSQPDVDANGSLLLNHKIFLASGHDEYWSPGQLANVKAARDAGVSLAFFTGNEIFWKTRWAPSIDGSNTARRTLITYKETHFNATVDPQDPTTWTGAWADPRFSPPADGGVPANALTGQMFVVNSGSADITVPYQYAKLRLWRNTAAASLTSGHSLTLDAGGDTLGYEWDVDADNGFRPPGLFDLSSTTVSGTDSFNDYGSLTQTATQTHHLTLYKASSGALVFGAGTVQWSWGLDNTNAWGQSTTDPSGNPPDVNMQQATVNLLADMGAQPATLMPGLVAATASTNSTPPTSTISSPSGGTTVQDGNQVTVTGTARAASGVVAGVEISTDGGGTWHPATLTTQDNSTVSWSYSWIAHGYPSTTIETRAVDDSGNRESPSDAITVNVNCPCSLWGANANPSNVPYATIDSGDANAITLGVKFTGSVDSVVTGVRFYKASTNTGTHVGDLWTSSGTLLAQATFSNESSSGWQSVTFSSPVVIQAGQTYIAGYFAPKGHYSKTPGWFYPGLAPTPLGGATVTSGPWRAVTASGGVQNGVQNGIHAYGSSSTFPTSTDNGATNYWVDPVLAPISAPGQVTGVTATGGGNSATVSWTAPSSGGPATTYTITPYIGTAAQTPTTVTGAPAPTTATITGLAANTTYTFTVQASNTTGAGPVSAPSNSVTLTQASTPSAPTNASAIPASAQALVSWTTPSSNGGTPITSYTITATTAGGSSSQVTVNSGSATSATVTGLTNGTSYTFKVAATNSVGTGSASAASSAVTPNDTIFDFSTPATVDSGDSTPNNLGVEFTPSVAGAVTGIRFYKASTNTGTHVGTLWDTSGNLLAQGTFSNETASGWQTLVFSNPVSVAAGTTYIASYLAPNGHFSMNRPGFSSAVTNGPLSAPASGSTTYGNGVYANGSTTIFPHNSYQSSNYWVDVLFNPGGSGGTATVPAAPTGVSASPATSRALVSWSIPSSNGGSPITSYTIAATPSGGSPSQVTVNGGSTTSAVVTGLTNGTSYTFTVAATNSVGTSQASSASSAVTPNNTILDFSTPATVDSGDSTPNNLGVEFTANQAGSITGIRFYKASTNTGSHVGSLWDTSGNLLAQGTFTNETASGWQTLIFQNPVPITGGTTYIASYLAPNGHFSMTRPGFNTAITNGPLTAPASSSTVYGNGVYANGSTTIFPTNSYQATNYGVDVLFSAGAPSTPPSAPTNVSAVPASSRASVSWTAPSSNGGSAITSYTVTPYVGSTAQTPVQVNSPSATSTTVTGLTNGTAYTFKVSATNAIGTGNASAASSTVTPDNTLFDLSTPDTVDTGDSTPNNLGVEFAPTQNGTVAGIRFYKAAANTGTHVGSLWDTNGNLLAQGTFTNETASGWQTLMFSSPVSVTAGTTYVASYLAPNGHFSMSRPGFNTAVTNGPLTAPASSSTTYGNGVYANGSTTIFPTNSYLASNYWVDVLFNPDGSGSGPTAPGAPTGVAAIPASSQAFVSWTAPSNNGGSPIGSYAVTPYIGSTAQTPVQVNSGTTTSATVTGLTNGTAYTFKVSATNSVGTGTASSASPVVTPNDTIFDFSTPTTVDSGDSTPNNLGVEFTPTANGTVTGMRFYKAAANTGTHVGSLWDASGNLLAQGTFTNETASGWQTLVFSTPVSVTAGTTYIASYLAPNGHFSMSRPGFNAAITNGPLTAPASSSTTYGNGVYANGSTTIFPTNSYQATNYWVDVLFNPS